MLYIWLLILSCCKLNSFSAGVSISFYTAFVGCVFFVVVYCSDAFLVKSDELFVSVVVVVVFVCYMVGSCCV